ncbi:hypothetical protein HPHPH4_1687 [Helicobacter pylori Hp H-4]|nr:hypothetical protein HPHPA4_1607 [Helicobacter pylori Hp A-4]EJB78510.1 hypothetical protein HPHPH4_1687 [Helicobacter pylori Hp H-4]
MFFAILKISILIEKPELFLSNLALKIQSRAYLIPQVF